MALALDCVLESDAIAAFPVSHPVLQHESGGGRIADRSAMRAAIGQRVYCVIGVLEWMEKIEVASA